MSAQSVLIPLKILNYFQCSPYLERMRCSSPTSSFTDPLLDFRHNFAPKPLELLEKLRTEIGKKILQYSSQESLQNSLSLSRFSPRTTTTTLYYRKKKQKMYEEAREKIEEKINRHPLRSRPPKTTTTKN